MLIVGLRLDVNTVSKALGHARPSITLDTYTHEFEKADSAEQVRSKLSGLIAKSS
jgi:integrase